MFNNYFKIALRNIFIQKGYALINILGLSISIIVCMLIILYVINELSYDRFYKNSDQIYRIYVNSEINGFVTNNSKTPGPLGPALKRDFPDIKTFTRIGYFGNKLLKYKKNSFREYSIYHVDSTFFDVFNLEFIVGNKNKALNKPYTMVLTESTSKKYFGNENPVGKFIQTDSEEGDYLITGVIKDFPKNSHFGCSILASNMTYPIINKEIWLELWYSTYIVLKKNVNVVEFQKKLDEAGKRYITPQVEAILGIKVSEFLKRGNKYSHILQPLNSIYLYSQRDYGIDLNTEWGDVKNSDINLIYIFIGVAGFILLIAIINFMNLATARSEKRAKEVGIRKVLGSNKFNIITQFIVEAIIMSFVSVIIALFLLELILPSFNNFTGKELSIHYLNDFIIIPLLLVFVIVLGLLSGSYPAFYLSSFTPTEVFKNNTKKGTRKSYLRNILVVFQFSISIILIAGTIIIQKQINFMLDKNLGFNKKQLLLIENSEILGNKTQTFKNELLKNSTVSGLSSSHYMFASGVPGHGYYFDGISGSDPLSLSYLDVDFDYIKTYQINMAEGRFFDREYSTDTSSVILNEAAVKEYGLINPIGKELTRLQTYEKSKSFKIIGVVKDFHWESLHQKIRPLVMHLFPENRSNKIISVRIKGSDLKNTINYIKNKWADIKPNEPIYYNFMDDNIGRLYETEEKISVLSAGFSAIAIIIACLGLFGLAAFTTEQRTKEIGIRKVMGAAVTDLVFFLTKDFTKWVVLANVIALPIVYFTMNLWLQNFAYRTEISWWIYLLSGTIAFIIALLTVSYQGIKAALSNPVECLKYE
ncbi:MAG: ABC transporter permease [bacterium]